MTRRMMVRGVGTRVIRVIGDSFSLLKALRTVLYPAWGGLYLFVGYMEFSCIYFPFVFDHFFFFGVGCSSTFADFLTSHIWDLAALIRTWTCLNNCFW